MTLLDQLTADEVHTNDRLKDVLAALDRVHCPERAGYDLIPYPQPGPVTRAEQARAVWLCRCGFDEWPCRTVREVAEALEFDVAAIARERETT